MEATGKNQYITFGSNKDVIKYIINYYEKWKNQPQNIVGELRNIPIRDVCYSIFCYVIENVEYKEDVNGYQFIKSPARLLKDGVGDCKSMTLFIASCLHCLGIKHTIRFVNFDGGEQFTHVYPIAYDEQGNTIIIDCVERDAQGEPIFDYARNYYKKYDINYSI